MCAIAVCIELKPDLNWCVCLSFKLCRVYTDTNLLQSEHEGGLGLEVKQIKIHHAFNSPPKKSTKQLSPFYSPTPISGIAIKPPK